ncbi:MAG TPA: patatin-like phospholipase family protein [bacterium]
MSDIKKRIALALSGGGFRATLFTLGSLWRLNEFGLLPRIDRITSVSGGSITSAYLAMKWGELDFNKDTGVANNFTSIIAKPLQEFCSKPLDILAGLSGLIVPFSTIGDKVAKQYAKRLFGTKTLQDIPAPGQGPEFIFYATSLQTGASVRFTRASVADYKLGELHNPQLPLAKVVGASSAFPPFFSPVIIKCDPQLWTKTRGAFLFDNFELRKKMVLGDGGIYDNMGLEAVWNDNFKTVFVCDAGAPFKITKKVPRNWLQQSLRVSAIITEQTRALRKRALIKSYLALDDKMNHLEYGGTYWGIATEIDNYELENAMLKDNHQTASLQHLRTRLHPFSKEKQGNLINWGYALSDTALRKWYFETNKNPGNWPIPEYSLDRY